MTRVFGFDLAPDGDQMAVAVREPDGTYHAVRWGDPNADPVGDIRRAVAQMATSRPADSFWMSARCRARIGEAIRASRSKRRLRRYRGRMKAERRQ